MFVQELEMWKFDHAGCLSLREGLEGDQTIGDCKRGL